MFNFLKKKQEIVERKSHSFVNSFSSSLLFLEANINNRNISPTRALAYYDIASPVSIAVDLIRDEFKNLRMVLETNGEVITEAPILEFLQNPNDDQVLQDFLESLGAFFLVTDEAYMIAMGSAGRPPSEIILVSPSIVDVKKGRDGFITQIGVQRTTGAREIFKRSETEFRFFTSDDNAEIWQIKGFNSQQNGRGKSKLNSLSPEIDQYIETAMHNLATLRNGLRPSGALQQTKDQDPLTDDQFERLREQVEQFYSGTENSGNALILEGGLEFKEMSINPKDMDFLNLQRTVTTAIFNRYKIPLPLINPDKMTLANMESAKLNLYDNAVLPFANRMFAEITRFLAPRFGLSEDTQIIPWQDKITALQVRRNQELKVKKDLEILTINEIRTQIGLDSIAEGGDVVYIPNNLVPAGTTEEDIQENQEESKTTRESFTRLMKGQMDFKGNRSFTDEVIDQIADDEGL